MTARWRARRWGASSDMAQDTFTLSLAEIAEATGARVDNMSGAEHLEFHGVVTDTRKLTRESTPLFIALKGEKFNGEDFALSAVEKGAAAIVVSDTFDEKTAKKISVPIFYVTDTLAAYQKIAAYWRRRFDMPVIAITGSNGKTTTKDLTASVLDAKFSGAVLKTQANFNNEIGLSMTLLNMRAHHRAAVVEIGMRGLGQIAYLAPLAAPTMGIVTNVGETHIELLGSIENIARAKAEMVEAIKAGGTVILNADDERVAAMSEKAAHGVRVVTFGIEHDATVRAYDVTLTGDAARFDVSFDGGERSAFVLPMVGRHNVMNALAALAAGYVLGLTVDEMKRGLLHAVVTGGRFERREMNGCTIINDAYNASPASMMAAFDTLKDTAKGRRIAVLGDMLELGDIAVRAHRDVGAAAYASGIDVLVTRGAMGEEIARGAMDAGMSRGAVYMCASHEAAADVLHQVMRAGDTILFKGSHGMMMEKIIDLL